jgi:hypothetical protein
MKVYQIYFDESHLSRLDYEPYFNPECSLFFENEVIKDLILKVYS